MSLNALEMKDVSFSYDHQMVLEDINFTIEEKDFVAILGPNGGGKSTLLKIVLGLLTPDKGVVKIFGK
ncbi:MAG TPA: ATP-binding cassette domain-containing protein, partial [Methanobacterium sp.]|nr:ATP-binding cassette domain-containing protein [Methanobacterium sp.]